jgi:hypothetical protein
MFKTVLCTLEGEGTVVAKLYIKRDPSLDSDLSHFKVHHDIVRDMINPVQHPNVHVGRLLLTNKAGIFIRQWFENNLYERLLKMP